MTNNLPQFTIKQLLEAGVHFGHKTMRRNPKMRKYIFGDRNDLSIINLEETAKHLHNSLKVVKEIAKNNGRILFVATKKQAFDAVEEAAKRCGQYHVNNRWLGGMLTNWKTISQSIKTLKKIEEQLANDELGLNKKERLVLDRQRIKLENALGGIRNMGGYPDLVFIIDINREALAVAEAKKLGVPIMAILDTNCNPDGIAFPIPGNDDSVKAIKLYCRLISDAVLAGIKENMAIAGVDVSKLESASSEEILEASNSKKSEEKKPEVKKDKVIKKSGAKPAAKAEAKKDSKPKAPTKLAAKKPAPKKDA
jgi:small subunit ribosomal protein S2